MKVLFLDSELIFSLIPRIFSFSSDELSLSLRNEMTDVILTPNFTYTIDDKLNITIPIVPTDFKTQNKYEITLKNNGEIVYLGKLIVLDMGTDIQNYNYGSQTNSRFEFK